MNKCSTILVIYTFVVVTLLSISKVNCHEQEIQFAKIAKELPIALSDMTATYVTDFKNEGEAIILTGGCSDENGNAESVEVVDGKNVTHYYCNTISKEAYVFYPSTYNIVKLPDMPSERYRHSAAFVDDKLYIIGGRTFNLDTFNFDELVKDIIVYDLKNGDTGTWTTLMTLSDDYATSDQTSFGKDGNIFILGGYRADYETSNGFFTLNVETKLIVEFDNMIKRRGDAQAVYYKYGNIEAVYIMGGFVNLTSNAFCEPLADAEMYDFSTSKWTAIDPLVNKRGDKGVVVLKDHILAIGGEDKHESICADVDQVEPSSHAVVVNDVESYNPQDGKDAKWEVETDFIQTRFRSAVAVAEKLDTVFVFGGQMAYDINCKCYKTSKDIYAYRDGDDNGASGRKIAISLTIVIAAATAFLL